MDRRPMTPPDPTKAALEAVRNARDLAMRMCIKARVPECGYFALIAQDLDAALAELDSRGREG